MLQENVEIVRRVIDAFNRGDLEAMLKDLAPSYQHDLSRAVGPWRGVYALDQIPKIFDDLTELWESNRYEVDEFIEAGEHVVTPFTNYLLGRDGIEVQAHAAFLWTVRDGSVARGCFYQERRPPPSRSLEESTRSPDCESAASSPLSKEHGANWIGSEPRLGHCLRRPGLMEISLLPCATDESQVRSRRRTFQFGQRPHRRSRDTCALVTGA